MFRKQIFQCKNILRGDNKSKGNRLNRIVEVVNYCNREFVMVIIVYQYQKKAKCNKTV